jgi:hypothetical protein
MQVVSVDMVGVDMYLDDGVGNLYSGRSALKPENIPIDTFRGDKARWILSDIASIWVVISMHCISCIRNDSDQD